MARPDQLFAPAEREFFDLFEEAGANIVRAAELLERMLEHWPDHGELARDVLVCEHEGDRITHDIIQRLNSTFVTPIDREDIYALASALDDIVDYTEEVADFLGLYRIEAPMVQAQQLARILHQACRAVCERDPAPAHLRATSTTTRSRSTGSRTTATAMAARGAGVAVRARDRPDGRDPLEGHLRPARGRGGLDRDARPTSSRASSSRTPECTATSSCGSSSARRWRSTSPTASTTPPTPWRPPISTRAMPPRVAVDAGRAR